MHIVALRPLSLHGLIWTAANCTLLCFSIVSVKGGRGTACGIEGDNYTSIICSLFASSG